MRILVTGSRGQLGTELARLVERDGSSELVGVDLPDHDLTDPRGVHEAVESFGPDLIVHAAALTDVDRCEAEPELADLVNRVATGFLADAARRVGAHVVYVSTDYVFDGSKVGPYVEDDEPNPQSAYGRSKLGGERELDPSWTVARTSWLCSAHGDNMVRTLLRLAEERETVSFVDDQIGHPTFAGDLAPMLLRLGRERLAGVFHTTNAGVVSWYGFAREVFAAAGHDPDRVRPIRTAALDPPRLASRPANSVLANAAWRAAGFRPARDFREPLAEVVAVLADRDRR